MAYEKQEMSAESAPQNTLAQTLKLVNYYAEDAKNYAEMIQTQFAPRFSGTSVVIQPDLLVCNKHIMSMRAVLQHLADLLQECKDHGL